MIPYHKPLELSIPDKNNIYMKESDCYQTGIFTNGKYVQELEEKIRTYYHVDYCIATSSCSMGLMLCINYGKPFSVQLPSFNWYSDKYILDIMNIEQWYNDIDKKTWLVEEEFRNDVSIYVHTFGNIGVSEQDYPIYDASHCMGSKLEDIGLASVISMAPTKLITSREGGLILTNNKDLYECVKEWRDKICRMNEYEAIYGLACFYYLKEMLNWKKKVFEYYKANIDGQFQEIPYDSNYNTIGFLNINNLKMPEGVEFRQYYEPLYKGLKNTDYVYENIICLPSWYGVDYKLIVDMINDAK